MIVTFFNESNGMLEAIFLGDLTIGASPKMRLFYLNLGCLHYPVSYGIDAKTMSPRVRRG
jgi:hypothetical protein